MSIGLFILRRLVLMVPLLIGVTLISFILAHVVPADPITANLGQRAISEPAIVAAFQAEWGLDQPLPVQYVVYLRNLLSGESRLRQSIPVSGRVRGVKGGCGERGGGGWQPMGMIPSIQ